MEIIPQTQKVFGWSTLNQNKYFYSICKWVQLFSVIGAHVLSIALSRLFNLAPVASLIQYLQHNSSHDDSWCCSFFYFPLIHCHFLCWTAIIIFLVTRCWWHGRFSSSEKLVIRCIKNIYRNLFSSKTLKSKDASYKPYIRILKTE